MKYKSVKAVIFILAASAMMAAGCGKKEAAEQADTVVTSEITTESATEAVSETDATTESTVAESTDYAMNLPGLEDKSQVTLHYRGTDMVLGETTVQDLLDAGWKISDGNPENIEQYGAESGNGYFLLTIIMDSPNGDTINLSGYIKDGDKDYYKDTVITTMSVALMEGDTLGDGLKFGSSSDDVLNAHGSPESTMNVNGVDEKGNSTDDIVGTWYVYTYSGDSFTEYINYYVDKTQGLNSVSFNYYTHSSFSGSEASTAGNTNGSAAAVTESTAENAAEGATLSVETK